MNIKDFIQGKFTYKFEEANMLTALISRGIDPEAEWDTIDEKPRELARADLLIVLATAFSSGGGTTKRGNWSETESSIQVGINDRLNFTKQANLIYAKYGEQPIGKTFKDGTNLW